MSLLSAGGREQTESGLRIKKKGEDTKYILKRFTQIHYIYIEDDEYSTSRVSLPFRWDLHFTVPGGGGRHGPICLSPVTVTLELLEGPKVCRQ